MSNAPPQPDGSANPGASASPLSDEATYTVDPAGLVTAWNAGAERLLGYPAEEIIGRPRNLLFVPADSAAGLPERGLRHALAAGRHEEIGPRQRRDGTTFAARATTLPLRDPTGRPLGFVEVLRNLDEERRTASALRESENLHRRLLEVMPDAVFVNVDDRIAYCNPAFLRLLGEENGENPVGRPALSIFHPRHHDVIRHRIAAIRTHNGKVPAIEEEVVRRDGTAIPVEVVAAAVVHSGRPAILVVLHDLRSRREIERRFRALIDCVADYAICTTDADGNLASWNDGAGRIFGYAAEEVLGRPQDLLFEPDGFPPRPEPEGPPSGRRVAVERRCLRKDGTPFWAEVARTALRAGDGTLQGFVQVIHDLTERREAEAALHAGEVRYRRLFHAIRDPLFVYDRETLAYLDVNEAAVSRYGYSRDEFLRMTVKDIRPAEDVPELLAMLARVGSASGDRGLWRHRTKDGTILDVEISNHGLELAGRQVCVVQARDVTAKRRSEAAAENANALLRAVADGTPDAVFVKDRQGKYLLFNAAAARFVGKPVAEVLGRDDTEVFDPDDARTVMESDRRVMESEQALTFEEVLHSNGTIRTFEANKAPLRDARGRVIGVIGISRDATERVRAEAAVRENQVLRRIAGRVARLGGWTIDLHAGKVTWSDEVCEIHDLPPGHRPELMEGLTYYPPEARERVEGFVRTCIEEGKPFDFESELITAAGRRIWVRSTGEAVRDPSGRIVGVQGAFQDISDRKRAEAERIDLADRLVRTLESITDGFFTLDRDWRFTYVNAEAERLILRRREELLGRTVWETFPETVGSTFEREYRRAVAENVSVRFVEFYPPLNGWFELRVYPSEHGLAVYFLDVTAVRQSEQALRAAESRFRAMIQNSWDVFHLVEPGGKIVFESPAVTRVLGYRPEDMLGRNVAEFIHPEDLPALQRRSETETAATGKPRTLVLRVRHLDGSWRWVESYEVDLTHHPDVRALAVNYRDITERHLAEESLRLRDRAIREVAQGILITDSNLPDDPIIFASAGVERITGYSQAELLGRNCRLFQGKDTDRETARGLREAVAAGRGHAAEILNYRKDGTPFWNAMSINPVRDAAGKLTHFVGVQSDVTERKQLEAQLRQSQKMEAVGRLAGGVAHDFNNLLTIISGYSELLLAMPGLDPTIRESVKSIGEAGERAAALTRQLLGFGRQAILQPKILDLNAVIVETAKMLRRLIGEDILFTTVLDPTIGRVKVDPGQLDQILMNLAVNARDAMPRGGKLTVETAPVVLDESYAATHLDCKPGPHVMLAMTDTGCGMSPDVMARVFEPFFTTKEVGKGTGLGLAMVFGIVRQSEGCIHVYSEPEHGTTFKIYFPAVPDAVPRPNSGNFTAGGHGSETILLVEDEEGVRGLASMSLRMHGYRVLTAVDGKDALRVAQAHRGALDLLLTDVVMPSISGPELAGAMKVRYPEIKVLFMSGYTDDAVVRHGLLEAEVAFIQKPYTPLGLARKVRQVLDEPGRAGR